MGISDKLKGALFQPDDAPVEPTPAPRPTRVISPGGASRPYSASTLKVTSMVTGQPDPEMQRDIEATLARCTKRGYDELQVQLGVLQGAIPDLPTRIKAASATVSAMLPGVRVQEAIAERLSALDQFQREFKAGLAQEVAARRASNEAHLAELRRKREELARVEQDIRDTEAALSNMKVESGEVENRLIASLAPYYTSLQQLQEQLT